MSNVRSGSVRAKILLLALGSLFSLLVVEIGLRFTPVDKLPKRQFHRVLGYVNRPGATYTFDSEGKAEVAINSEGWRDKERTLEKPSDTIRIAVIGDSYVEALQVDSTDRFTEIVERELNLSATSKVEVLNFGCSGFGTAQAYLTLKHFAMKYDPDYVVLAFLTFNDISDNSREISNYSRRPYFVLNNDELELDDSFLSHEWYHRLVERSSVVRLAWNGLAGYRRWRAGVDMVSKAPNGEEIGVADATYLKQPESDEWNSAWNVTERLLSKMQHDCAASDVGFSVVTLSSGIQVHPDRELREDYKNTVGISDFFYPEQRLRNHCTDNDIDLLVLAPELQSIAESSQQFFHGFENTKLGSGHWNESGHRMAALRITEHLNTRTLR